MNKSDPTFVTGTKQPDGSMGAPYRIQPPIDHPAFCVCSRCEKLPAEERTRAHVVRILRRSPFPNSYSQTAIYAVDVKRQLERELRQGMLGATSQKMTLREICDLYFEMNPNKVSPATITRDGINAANLCRLINSMPDSIDEPIVVRYRNARETETAAPRTIMNEMSFLKMILGFGRRWERETGMLELRLYDLPEVGDWIPPGVALTAEEFGKVLAIARPRERLMAITGVTTMLRRTPLMAFQRPWIDDARQWLTVPAEFMKKGRARRRYPLEAPIADCTMKALRAAGTSQNGYYWPSSKTDSPMTWVDHIFADLSTRAGVREFSCHDLRTTGATWLRGAGVDELVIGILMGHSATVDADNTFHARSTNVTRGYTKLFEPTLRAAVAVFDDLSRPWSD